MRRIEFKRGMIFSAALLLQCVAYGQIPNGERAHPTNPVEGCADANPKTMLPNDT